MLQVYYQITKLINYYKNGGKLLIQSNQNLYGQLERDLINKIEAFLELQSIDCNSYKIYRNIFTGHIDNILGMYNRIERISSKSGIQLQLRNSGYSTTANLIRNISSSKSSSSNSSVLSHLSREKKIEQGLLDETNI